MADQPYSSKQHSGVGMGPNRRSPSSLSDKTQAGKEEPTANGQIVQLQARIILLEEQLQLRNEALSKMQDDRDGWIDKSREADRRMRISENQAREATVQAESRIAAAIAEKNEEFERNAADIMEKLKAANAEAARSLKAEQEAFTMQGQAVREMHACQAELIATNAKCARALEEVDCKQKEVEKMQMKNHALKMEMRRLQRDIKEFKSCALLMASAAGGSDLRSKMARKRRPTPLLSSDDDGSQNEDGEEKKSTDSDVVLIDSDDERTPGASDEDRVRDEEENKKSGQVLMEYGGMKLTFDDMRTLVYGNMVNDTIVDLSLAIMKDGLDPAMYPRTHIFSCFFYQRLTTGMDRRRTNYGHSDEDAAARFATVEHNYATTAKWNKGVDLFQMDYILVPVVDDDHWYLILIIEPDKCILPADEMNKTIIEMRRKGYQCDSAPNTVAIILDSMYNRKDKKRETAIDIVRDYLELEYVNKKAASNPELVFDRSRIDALRPEGLPQQSPDSTACGFYMLKFAETFMKSPPKENGLLQQGVHWREWFQGFEMGTVRSMREKVVKSIRERTNQQVWQEYEKFIEDWREREKESTSISPRRKNSGNRERRTSGRRNTSTTNEIIDLDEANNSKHSPTAKSPSKSGAEEPASKTMRFEAN